MLGFWVIGVAVLLNTVNKLYTKFAVTSAGSYTFLLAINLISVFLSLPFLLFHFDEFSTLTNFQILFMLLVGGLWSLNGYLSHLTIDNSEVSVREPLTQLQIIWATLLGVFIFQEKINLQVVLGILTILASGFVLVFKKDFFKNFSKEKHLLLILTYTIFTTLVAAAEKFVMKFTIPEVFMFFSYLMTTLFLLPFVKVNMSEIKDSLSKKQVLFWGGVLTFITYIATLYVYKNFDFAISYPLLKIATPLTAIFGILIFNEKNMLGRKVLAITLATLGAILVKVSF